MSWPEEDRTSALEWIEYQSSLCSGCGFPKSECMDKANEGHYDTVPLTCFACQARDREQRVVSDRVSAAENRSDKLDRAALDGVYIGVAEKGGGG